MGLDPKAFGEGSYDYTAYLACINSPSRVALRKTYEDAFEEWTRLDNFIGQGGITNNGQYAYLPEYGSYTEMVNARTALENKWRVSLAELQRTEQECNKIQPYYKSPGQLADESLTLATSGGGIVPSDAPLPPPTISGSIPPGPSSPTGDGPTTMPINPSVTLLPPTTASGGAGSSGSAVPQISPEGTVAPAAVEEPTTTPAPTTLLLLVAAAAALYYFVAE